MTAEELKRQCRDMDIGHRDSLLSVPCAECINIALRKERAEGKREALEALARQFAQLRHLYDHMVNGRISGTTEAANGLLAPAIRAYERALAHSGERGTGDRKPREPGCKCHWEEGDSACPVHGEEGY